MSRIQFTLSVALVVLLTRDSSSQEPRKEALAPIVNRWEVVNNVPPPAGNFFAPATRISPDNTVPSSMGLKHAFPLIVAHDPSIQSLKVSFMHQLAARKLTVAHLFPPQDRIQYFDSLFHASLPPIQSLPPIKGWSAIVSSVDTMEGGVIATLRVYAKRGSFVDSAYILERYSIVNDSITYLGYSRPIDVPRLIFR